MEANRDMVRGVLIRYRGDFEVSQGTAFGFSGMTGGVMTVMKIRANLVGDKEGGHGPGTLHFRVRSLSIDAKTEEVQGLSVVKRNHSICMGEIELHLHPHFKLSNIGINHVKTYLARYYLQDLIWYLLGGLLCL